MFTWETVKIDDIPLEPRSIILKNRKGANTRGSLLYVYNITGLAAQTQAGRYRCLEEHQDLQAAVVQSDQHLTQYHHHHPASLSNDMLHYFTSLQLYFPHTIKHNFSHSRYWSRANRTLHSASSTKLIISQEYTCTICPHATSSTASYIPSLASSRRLQFCLALP